MFSFFSRFFFKKLKKEKLDNAIAEVRSGQVQYSPQPNLLCGVPIIGFSAIRKMKNENRKTTKFCFRLQLFTL